MNTSTWRTVDFRPVATSGWRVITLNDSTGWASRPLVGWLIQEEIESSRFVSEHPTGVRRAVAAVMADKSEPEPASAAGDFWKVLGPGEDDPYPQQEAEHRGLT
jgi:hypothetical protein